MLGSVLRQPQFRKRRRQPFMLAVQFPVLLSNVLLLACLAAAAALKTGLVKSNPSNAQPFLPYGVRGIFNGAAIVFFSYIGFDAVATSAEEVSSKVKWHRGS